MTATTKTRRARQDHGDALVARATQTDAPTLHGEVITWHAGATANTHRQVLDALEASSLAKDDDEARGLARPRHPRHAFARACRTLSAERIIRLVKDDKDKLTFQFTAEQLVGEEYQYVKETLLTLDKDSGHIDSDVPALTHLAQAELDRHLAEWSAGDVSTIVQRLFDRETGVGLCPLRNQGGCYLVLRDNVAFAEKVERFLTHLGGGMRRLPVVAGTPQGDRTVKESLKEHMAGVIAEYETAVQAFGVSTQADTLERAAGRVRALRHTIEGYRQYLADETDAVVERLADAGRKLQARVEQIAEARDAGSYAECDECHCLQGVPEGTTLHRCKQCGQDFAIEW